MSMLWPMVVPVLFPLMVMKFCFRMWSSCTTQLFAEFCDQTLCKINWHIMMWFSCRMRLSVRNLDRRAALSSKNFCCLSLFSNSVWAAVYAL